jgi:hypothetical protein
MLPLRGFPLRIQTFFQGNPQLAFQKGLAGGTAFFLAMLQKLKRGDHVCLSPSVLMFGRSRASFTAQLCVFERTEAGYSAAHAA